MPQGSKVKPTHKAVKSYYAALEAYADQSVEHEGALRTAFQNLLSETGRKVHWTLIPELSLNAFFSHTEPAHEDFNKAVDEFKQRVPDLARGLVDLISKAHKNNKRFIDALGSRSYNRHESAVMPRFAACVRGRNLRRT